MDLKWGQGKREVGQVRRPGWTRLCSSFNSIVVLHPDRAVLSGGWKDIVFPPKEK